jgi:hypothetical protein
LLRLPKDVQVLVDAGGKQQISTTATGSLSVDSASRIAAASSNPDDARLLARKAIEERLTTREIRTLTALFKQAASPSEKRMLLDRPFARFAEGGERHHPIASSKYHAEDIPISDQWQGKILWNLRRLNLADYDHFSIGYSGRSLDQLVEILTFAGVTCVADIRRNPISQFRPEFSKNRLSKHLEDKNIKYAHFPNLGIGSAERKKLGEQDSYSALFDDYEKRVTWDIVKQELGPLLIEERIAFLCVEIDPHLCHRHRLMRTLEGNHLRTLDL